MTNKKLLLWIGLVATVVAVAELVSGTLLKAYMRDHMLPGDLAPADHVLRASSEDILLLGSSVALYDIDARRVQDSLGVTCYNGGGAGQAFQYYLSILKGTLSHRPPQMILLCLIEGNLRSTINWDEYKRLSLYYGMGIADIDSVLDAEDTFSPIVNRSALYRLNGKWLKLFRSKRFDNEPASAHNGSFIITPPDIYPERWPYEDDTTLSDECRGQLLNFIRICNTHGVMISVILTPRFFTRESAPESPLARETRAICEAHGVGFYNDSRMEPFNSDSTFFNDCVHLNVNGVNVYTDTIIRRLRNSLKMPGITGKARV